MTAYIYKKGLVFAVVALCIGSGVIPILSNRIMRGISTTSTDQQPGVSPIIFGVKMSDECDLVVIENFPDVLDYLLRSVWSRYEDTQSFDLSVEDKTGDNTDLLFDMTEFVLGGRELEMLGRQLSGVKG